MKAGLLLSAACLMLLPQVTSAEELASSIGFSEETRLIQDPEDSTFCPATTLRRNDNGTFENGYAWRFGSVVPPDYGSWAECYEAEFVCKV